MRTVRPTPYIRPKPQVQTFPARWPMRMRVWLPAVFLLAVIVLTLAIAGHLLMERQQAQGGDASPRSLAAIREVQPINPAEIAADVAKQDRATDQQAVMLRLKKKQLKPMSFDRYLRHDGLLLRAAGEMEMEVTAYCADEESCAPYNDGITASGEPVTTNGGKLVAADTNLLPFGTLVTVPGYAGNDPVPVLDRGGAIQGKRLDLLMPEREQAMEWGRRTVRVVVWEVVGRE